MAAYAQSHIIKKGGGGFLSLSVDICEHATVCGVRPQVRAHSSQLDTRALPVFLVAKFKPHLLRWMTRVPSPLPPQQQAVP